MDEEGNRAYDELFRREHAAIVRTAFLVVGDLEMARELAQEAFARLYLHWPRVSRYDRPGAWVRRVTIRLAVKADRRARRIDRAMIRSAVSEVDRVVDSEMIDKTVIAALAELPPRQRAVVVLVYLEDLPVAEVAYTLGCAEATVRVHLHRARGRLAELLGEPQEEVRDVVG